MSYKSLLSDIIKDTNDQDGLVFGKHTCICFKDVFDSSENAHELALINPIFTDFNWMIFNILVVNFKKYNNIRRLEITNALLPKHSLIFMKGMHNLRELCLRDNDLTNGFMDVLCHVPRLDVLDISGNGLISDLRFLWYIPNVRKLNVSETGVMDDNLSCLKYTPRLEQLFIHDTEITDAGVTHMLVLTKLTALDVSDTNVTDAGYNFLKKSLVNLVELWNGQSYTVTEDDLVEMDDA